MFDPWARKAAGLTAVPADCPDPHAREFHADVDALWSRMTRQFEARSVQHARVAICGFNPSGVAILHDLALDLNVASCVDAGPVSVLSTDWRGAQNVDIVIVNLEVFGDVVTAIDTLRGFRTRTSHIGVILVSSKVRGDDLGRERAPICDATLRAPVTLPRLEQALLGSFSYLDSARSPNPYH